MNGDLPRVSGGVTAALPAPNFATSTLESFSKTSWSSLICCISLYQKCLSKRRTVCSSVAAFKQDTWWVSSLSPDGCQKDRPLWQVGSGAWRQLLWCLFASVLSCLVGLKSIRVCSLPVSAEPLFYVKENQKSYSSSKKKKSSLQKVTGDIEYINRSSSTRAATEKLQSRLFYDVVLEVTLEPRQAQSVTHICDKGLRLWGGNCKGLETANLSLGRLFKWNFCLILPLLLLFSHCTMLLTLPCTTSVSHLSPSWLTASWNSTSTLTHWPQIHSCICKSQGAGWASAHFKLWWCTPMDWGGLSWCTCPVIGAGYLWNCRRTASCASC